MKELFNSHKAPVGGPAWGLVFLAVGVVFLVLWYYGRKDDTGRREVASLFDGAVPDSTASKVVKTAERPGVTSIEWLQLADRFKKLSRHVHVNSIQRGGDDALESWTIGGSTNKETDECRALCSLAGTMLSRSPHLCRCLSVAELSQPDAADRWLSFLKRNGAWRSNGYGTETLHNGEQRQFFSCFLGMINDLAGASSTACISCSANAL